MTNESRTPRSTRGLHVPGPDGLKLLLHAELQISIGAGLVEPDRIGL